MNKIRTILAKFPPHLLTTITVAAILWLTLAPQPTPEMDIPLFPGFDKLAHALMFGFLMLMAFLDRWRKHQPTSLKRIICYLITISFFGLLIEFLQLVMDAGRSFEWTDWIADTIGTIFVAAIICIFLIKAPYSSNK